MRNLFFVMMCLMGMMSSSFAGITITQDGTIIENQYVTGQISIEANNCIIRNCYIDVGDGINGSWYGIHAANWDSNGNPFTGNLIENCEIEGAVSSGVFVHYTTVRRNNIHDCGADAIKARSGSLIEYNWCHNIGIGPNAHADCLQIRFGSNIEVRYNWFDIPVADTAGGYKSNACIIFGSLLKDSRNINIHHNRMEGGNYTVYLEDSNGYSLTNVKLHDNYFGPDFKYGVLTGKSPYNWRQRRISIDRNYWFDGTLMNSGPFDINNWDGDNK